VRTGVSRRLDKVVVERIPFLEEGLALVGVLIVIVDSGVDGDDGIDGVGVGRSVGVDPRRDRT